MYARTLCLTRVGFGLFFLFSSLFAHAQVTSDFSVDNDGWQYFNASTSTSASANWSNTGGNPTGNISVSATSFSATSINFYFVAPAKFLGNVSKAYNQNLSFDLMQSSAANDNSVDDIILTGGGITLVYQLPSKPAASWTSYSIQINETVSGWSVGTHLGLPPTKNQMKQVLSNLISLKIRGGYYAGVGTQSGYLDNVRLNQLVLSVPPVLTSFTPISALAGASVTINGSNFSSTPSQNIVYFSGVKATVTSASPTQLVVTVPTSACVGKITVINSVSSLEGSSNLNFNPLFNNNSDFGGRVTPSTFKPGYQIQLPMAGSGGNNFGNTDKGDFNNDGWVDLVTTETSTRTIFVFQNIGAGATLSASSFGTPVQLTLPSLSSSQLSEVRVADFDNDGKLDIAASVEGTLSGANAGYFAVFRNTSTSSTISFASPIYFEQPYNSALVTALADLDSDGLVDLIGSSGSGGSFIWVCMNQSTPGFIDFAFGVQLGSALTALSIAPGDFDGDSKMDLAIYGYSSTNIYVYQNTSIGGVISFAAPFTLSAPSGSSYGGVYATDLDADGKPDLSYANYNNGNFFVRKNNYSSGALDATAFGAQLTFTSSLSSATGVRSCDVNADGKPEIVLSGGNDLAVFQNVGSGALSSSSFLQGVIFRGSLSGSSSSLFFTTPTLADLDGDNKSEVVMAYMNSSSPASEKGVYIFHNESFQPPQITAVNPLSAAGGSTITVTGNYLYTENATPQISGMGVVTPASNVSNTSLQINTPAGASDNRLSATLHGLQAFSPTQFFTQLNGGSGGPINSSIFGASIDFNLSSTAANPGLAVADFDRDGKPDIIIDDNGTGKIYANTLSAAGATITTASFTKLVSTLNTAAHLRATDLDGNGVLDVIANGSAFAGQGISPSAISFSASTPMPISNNTNQLLVNHDFNLDGKPDIVASSTTSNQIQVFENFANVGAPFSYSGSLQTLSNAPLNYPNPGTIIGLTSADFDGDSFDDIAYGVTSTTSTLNVLLNAGLKQVMTLSQFIGPTTFTSLSTPQYIATADFNGDGKLDIALGYSSANAFVSVYLNTSIVGNLSFTRQDFASPPFCNGLEVGDIDGDGRPEIVSINNPSATGSFSILRNTSSSGAISFSPAVTFSLGTTVPTILALADVNLDNKTDIIISRTGSSNATLSIFQNSITFPTISVTSQPTSVYSVCDGATPTLATAANGTTNIVYQWQIFNTGSGGYVDLTNISGYSNVSTSSMTINSAGNFGAGTYRCKISGDFAIPAYSNTVSFSINANPPTPTASDVNFCAPSTVVLTASGASAGQQYMWYDQSGLIPGQNASSYTTPTISTNSSYSVAITDGTCVSPKKNINAVAQVMPPAPVASDKNFCPPGTASLTASGGSNGQYLWYDQNGSVISGQTNGTYITPSISSTTSYSVAINNGFCTSAKTVVKALAQAVPAAPTSADVPFCPPNAVSLSASGAGAGQYVWYDQNGVISGQTNSTYTTPSLSSSTLYSVAVSNGQCTSTKTAVQAVATPSLCSKPAITPEPLTTQVGGQITIDLKPLISTPNSTLDLSSLQIVVSPSSGATASINSNGILTITYSGISFSGTENITIKACDTNHNCTQQQFGIEVAGDLHVFNGISPDGANPKFIIQYIDLLPQTKTNTVQIFDRWENLVWHGTNYDNNAVVFTGHNDTGTALPSGVYFYKIEFASGRSTITGFISLRR